MNTKPPRLASLSLAAVAALAVAGCATDAPATDLALLSRVWGYDYDPGSNIVETYVRYLRRKLGPDRIETVRGMGCRLR